MIVSSSNGTSEIIKDGVNGLILEERQRREPRCRAMIRQLYERQGFPRGGSARTAARNRARIYLGA